jgi:peptidoglycan-associated lipoprotein
VFCFGKVDIVSQNQDCYSFVFRNLTELESKMKVSLSSLFSSSLVLASVVACTSKQPVATTPEITEPVPTAATEAVAPAPVPEAPVADASALNLQTVYFDFDSYSLNGSAQDGLRQLSGAMKVGSNLKIQVEGHCDERGSNEYNLALGERRARAIKDFLIGEGVTEANLTTISFGEERPASQGSSEDSWTKNRRGEFRKM